MATVVPITIGQYRKMVSLETKGDRIYFKYEWWPELNAEIKASFSYKWNDLNDKRWSVHDDQHAQFRLQYMMGRNPYARYDTPLPAYVSPKGRPLMAHQCIGTSHLLTRRHAILAAEPGTGKSLMVIEAAEAIYQPGDDAFWIAPKTALLSVRMECDKWDCKVPFQFLTYDAWVSRIAAWPKGKPTPKIVIFDEASRNKNAETERAKSCRFVADRIREERGYDSLIVLMSGTPSPQSPLDWYSLIQIARPGYLKEGQFWQFRQRLCLEKRMESQAGGTFPKLVTWYDDERKCKTCGQFANDVQHTLEYHPDKHDFLPSSNEVSGLYKRMNGLTLVLLKKDCLDLPTKHFRRLKAVIPQSMRRAADLIKARVGVGAKALTLLRELSDGFQYVKHEVGQKPCDLCEGVGKIADMAYIGPEPTEEFLASIDVTTMGIIDPVLFPQYWQEQYIDCCKCSGTGEVAKVSSEAQFVETPKDELFTDLLDEYSDVGRFVVYGAFQGTIDRLVSLATKKDWQWIKADGRSWKSSMGGNPISWLTDFQNPNSPNAKVVFIGQPEAAGMGITLTRSPVVCFYSNSANGESRDQALDRVHRISAVGHLHTFGGEPVNGVMVYDLIGLPSDERILTLLENKGNLQALTLGQMQEVMAGNDHD